jgi:hypothetical protein
MFYRVLFRTAVSTRGRRSGRIQGGLIAKSPYQDSNFIDHTSYKYLRMRGNN